MQYQGVQCFIESQLFYLYSDDRGGILTEAVANEFYSDLTEQDNKLSPDARKKLDDFCRWVGNRHGFVASLALPRILDHVRRFKPSVIGAMVARDRDRIPEPEAELLDAMTEPSTEPATAAEPVTP